MKKLFFIFILIISNLFADIGDTGSKVDIKEVKLKVELIKDDGSAVTILNGSKYLKINGSSSTATSIGDSLAGSMPPAGTYTHIRWTPLGFRIKAKVVVGNVTYYTKNITVQEDDNISWDLSQNESDYDITTITPGSDTKTVTVKFPTPLVIEKNKSVNLYYVSKFTGQVQYSGNTPDVTWISNVTEAFAFVDAKPSKMIQFDLNNTYNGNSYINKVALFYDSDDKLLGAYVGEPSTSNQTQNGSMNPAFVLESNQTNGHYTLKVDNDSESNVDYYLVSFDLNSTHYSNPSIKVYPGGNDLNGTLTQSGVITSKDINFTE